VSSYRYKGELGSHDALVITLAPGTTADTAIDAVDTLLSETLRTRMDPQSVDIQRLRYCNSIVHSLESFDLRAAEYSAFRDVTGHAQFAATLLDRYDAVRSWSVRDLKARWFPGDARVITVVHPVKGAPIAGRLVSAR
jgi:predicted Zn-dependent peptidase